MNIVLVLVYISIRTISLILPCEFLKLRTVVNSNLKFRPPHKCDNRMAIQL